MRRNPGDLAGRRFDLLVVGGGIHGACVAWDATLRGLSVALVERGDFGGATSANSLRIAHGGLRYLARGDIGRMRDSIRERSRLLALAPDLVAPLPVLVPTRGLGFEGRAAMRLALAANDLASADRNRGLGAAHRIPRGRVLSRSEAVRLFPPLAETGLTGAALWYDARILSPERLTLAVVRSAAERGAVVANYVEVERIRTEAGTVSGAEAVDRRTGAEVRIDARAVVIAAGAWTAELAARTTGRVPGDRNPRGARQSVALNLMVGRRLAPVAVGVRCRTGPEGDPVIGGRRHLFIVPQEDCTLVGTWYAVDDGADPAALGALGAERLRCEINEACPGLDLGAGEVSRVQLGWMPLKAGLEPGRPDALADRPRIVDHTAEGALGLFSVEGVKYTTARLVAERALDGVVRSTGFRAGPSRTAETPLTGAHPVAADDPRLGERVRRAVREEMALTLADVVYRRTGIGEPPGPSPALVEQAAQVAAEELGWDPATRREEVADVMRRAGLPATEHGVVHA